MFTRTTNRIHTGVSALVAVIMVIAVGGFAPPAKADILHDTLWMTDNGTYNHFVPSQISAFAPNLPNTIGDMNAADDFTLSGKYNIFSVTGDFGSTAAYGGQGVLVEFFADIGGAPSAAPTAAAFASLGSGLSITPMTLAGVPAGMRFTVDLSSAGITLDAGTWWMSMVVVHETTPSQIYRQLRQTGFQEGGELHVRDGGVAHGNGYGGTWGVSDWTPISNFSNEPGDLAMRIDGTLIPAPGALALIGLAGLFSGGRRRKNV